jgi:hypothetical protein
MVTAKSRDQTVEKVLHSPLPNPDVKLNRSLLYPRIKKNSMA